MAFTELELKRCEKALAQFPELRRPPPHVRDQLDFSYKVKVHSVESVEIRPDWRDRTKKIETASGQGDVRSNKEPLEGLLDAP
jgi:hypothetical protein